MSILLEFVCDGASAFCPFAASDVDGSRGASCFWSPAPSDGGRAWPCGAPRAACVACVAPLRPTWPGLSGDGWRACVSSRTSSEPLVVILSFVVVAAMGSDRFDAVGPLLPMYTDGDGEPAGCLEPVRLGSGVKKAASAEALPGFARVRVDADVLPRSIWVTGLALERRGHEPPYQLRFRVDWGPQPGNVFAGQEAHVDVTGLGLALRRLSPLGRRGRGSVALGQLARLGGGERGLGGRRRRVIPKGARGGRIRAPSGVTLGIWLGPFSGSHGRLRGDGERLRAGGGELLYSWSCHGGESVVHGQNVDASSSACAAVSLRSVAAGACRHRPRQVMLVGREVIRRAA